MPPSKDGLDSTQLRERWTPIDHGRFRCGSYSVHSFVVQVLQLMMIASTLSLLLLLRASYVVALLDDEGLDFPRRRLAYEMIAGYQPITKVTSENAIDLDQLEFSKFVALGTLEGYEQAMRIYSEGAFSEPIAFLTLTTPLREALAIGDVVIGTSQDSSREVKGHIVNNYPRGTSTIRVIYETNEVQSDYTSCLVAANPNPKLDGCYASDGLVIVTGVARSLSYTYDLMKDNRNLRYMERFSKDARVQMEVCKTCPYDNYIQFRNYYGSGDYADQWIRAALEGSQTDFRRGNADFRSYGKDGKYGAMTTATAYMSFWLYVIREMEDALDKCVSKPVGDASLNSWDEAVAYYTGSLEGINGTHGDGVLMYSLAEKMCQEFRTCGEDAKSDEGTSNVNLQVFDEFRMGQEKFLEGDCAGAREHKERIVQLMAIPLIQATLRLAYYQSTGELATERAEAEGATFAAAVLPLIHDCDGGAGEQDATIIYENMKTKHGPTDFAQVKAAFELNYRCLGITCAEVGGVWDSLAMLHKEGAMPCVGQGPNRPADDDDIGMKNSPDAGLAVGLTFGGFFCLGLIVAVTTLLGKKSAPLPSIPPPSDII